MYSDNASNDRWGAKASNPQRYAREVNELDYIVPRGGYYFEHDDRDVWKPSRGRLQSRDAYAGGGGHHLSSRNADTGFSPHPPQPWPQNGGSRAHAGSAGPMHEEERRGAHSDAARPPISARLGGRQRPRSASRERSPPPRRPREEGRPAHEADRRLREEGRAPEGDRRPRDEGRAHEGDRRRREEGRAQDADGGRSKQPGRLRSTVHSAVAGQERASAHAEDGAAGHDPQQRTGERANPGSASEPGSRAAGGPPNAGEAVQPDSREAARRERPGARLPSQVLGRGATGQGQQQPDQAAQQGGGRWQQQPGGGPNGAHGGVGPRFAGRLGPRPGENGVPSHHSQPRARPRGGMRSDHGSKWGHDLFEEAEEEAPKEPDLLQRTLLF